MRKPTRPRTRIMARLTIPIRSKGRGDSPDPAKARKRNHVGPETRLQVRTPLSSFRPLSPSQRLWAQKLQPTESKAAGR
jgi:hypothetical protein